ncbi:hypothetical protein [Aphanothece sacrum]|uniref:hypothetical protein n=1 Tax=Aphanothece sacrum TaxID=1122 RepID=UPI000F60F818
MQSSLLPESSSFSESLKDLVVNVNSLAHQCEGDSQKLLALLRILETLHREIRSDMFEPSLPNTRNSLYEILREIEETGGWPYIERMKLQTLIQCLSEETPPNTELQETR